LNVIECLGFIKGTNCPHFNTESDRKPTIDKFLKSKKIKSCLASDDGAALHYKNGKLFTAISFYKNANSYELRLNSDNAIEQNIIRSIQI
jgi:hypothetical protein